MVPDGGLWDGPDLGIPLHSAPPMFCILVPLIKHFAQKTGSVGRP